MRRKIFPIIIAAIGILSFFEGDFGDYIVFLMLAVGFWLIYRGIKGRKVQPQKEELPFPVSYTHLTLPTKLEV